MIFVAYPDFEGARLGSNLAGYDSVAQTIENGLIQFAKAHS
jgi:hypothetical protein